MNNTSEGEKTRPAGQGKAIESTQGQLKDLPVAELLKRLQTSSDGLSKAEAENRQVRLQ
jgi:hypothetical protein